MNWFREHLNWTVVFSWLASYCVFIGIAGLLVLLIPEDVHLNKVMEPLSLAIVLTVSFLLLPISVAIWTLREKNRRLWWVLLLYVPTGALFFLLLKNKKEIQLR